MDIDRKVDKIERRNSGKRQTWAEGLTFNYD